jgi:hypothetical protein
MWKFFGRRKGEQLNVPPPANENAIQLKTPRVLPEDGKLTDDDLIEIIRECLLTGGAVIVEWPDDGS